MQQVEQPLHLLIHEPTERRFGKALDRRHGPQRQQVDHAADAPAIPPYAIHQRRHLHRVGKVGDIDPVLSGLRPLRTDDDRPASQRLQPPPQARRKASTIIGDEDRPSGIRIAAPSARTDSFSPMTYRSRQPFEAVG